MQERYHFRVGKPSLGTPPKYPCSTQYPAPGFTYTLYVPESVIVGKGMVRDSRFTAQIGPTGSLVTESIEVVSNPPPG